MRNRKLFTMFMGVTITVVTAIALSNLTTTRAKAQTESEQDDPTSYACNLATVKGVYGVLSSGTYLSVGPIAAEGRLIIDGAGHFAYSYTENTAGTVSSGTVDGTYTVHPGCRANATFSNGITYSAIIVRGGDEIDLISTVPSSLVATAVAKRVDICRAKR